jgi:4'-phosphopantetheinyl transferase EntD
LALKRAYQLSGGPRALTAIEVIRDAAGRPAIAGARVWCSLAHGGGGGLGVVGPVPVGADLERVGRYDTAFVRAVADVREIAAVGQAGVPGELVPTVAWTLKEAVLKAIGIGLSLHPRRAVIAAWGADGWLVRVRDQRDRVTSWQVVAVRRDGLCLAVARPLGAESVRLERWRAEWCTARQPRAEVVA